ncbi:hypothetical protein Tco_0879825 [Tanacetum coccineum]
MVTMAENVIAAGSETCPPMLEKGMYDSWKTQIILYIRGKENGEMLKDSIDNGPYQFKSEITVKDTGWSTEMTKQESESMLYDEFDKFTSEPRELIHSYYLRFTKLINDMKMIPMTMSPMQINTKFVNHLLLKWSRFVTTAKQARDLHSVTFSQLYAFLNTMKKMLKNFEKCDNDS